MKEPWFKIVDVVEQRGRSMADIAAEVAAKHGVPLSDMRRGRFMARGVDMPALKARTEALGVIKRERPDLSSAQVATYFNREASVIRHIWRQQAAQEAA